VKLAHAKAQLKKYDEALEMYRDALEIRCGVLGCNHPSVAKLKCQIGLLYFEAGESLAAQAAFEDALSIYTTNKNLDDQNHMRGEQTPILLCETNDYALQETLFNLGTIQLKRRNFDQATFSLEKALEVRT
jgi:Tfp pilus assembly protein PilF